MTVSTLYVRRSGFRPRHGRRLPGAGTQPEVERADGSTVELAGCGSAHVEPGDALVIETPAADAGQQVRSARRRR